jgi:hypothetical protein
LRGPIRSDGAPKYGMVAIVTRAVGETPGNAIYRGTVSALTR